MKLSAFTILLVLLTVSPAKAEAWPKLEASKKTEECTEALKIAKEVFHFNAFYLYTPPVLPKSIDSTLVLGPSAVDVSGGDGIKFDADVFNRLPGPDNPLYWQARANSGFHLVLQANSFGWRGDQYTLYSIPEDVKPEQFLAQYDRSARRAALPPVIGEGWRPPLVLQNRDGILWAIDVGHPAAFFPQWHVYTRRSGKDMELECKIYFGPDEMPPTGMLPQPVRQLAKLLAGTMGSGRNEGTLHPTARIATGVGHTWAAVSLRPWALSENMPYNTREDVDRHLMEWARPVKSFYKLHQDIYEQYPTAQKALEKYYVSSFGKSPLEAKKLAAKALDIAFRSYFVFPR